MKKYILMAAVILTIIMGAGAYKVYADSHLTSNQQKVADIVADVTIKNFDKYHIYPALTVGIALQESSLGNHCAYYNLFGIKSGAEHYGSYEEATLRVLEVLNNGYYPSVPNNSDYYSCADSLNGVYCVVNPNYARELCSGINKYGFTKYNEKLAKIQKKKRLKKLRNQKFNVIIDKSLKDDEVCINKEVAGKCNTATIYDDYVLNGIYDITIADIPTDTIKVSNSELKGKITIGFYNAKG